MNWKTDWGKTDNHARNGSADLDRLLRNYSSLKTMLTTEFNFSISFVLPITNGYRTYPFQDILNMIETALNALHIWVIPWVQKSTIWKAGEALPTYEDINRWEKNGQAIEQAADRVKAAYYYMNELYMGEV